MYLPKYVALEIWKSHKGDLLRVWLLLYSSFIHKYVSLFSASDTRAFFSGRYVLYFIIPSSALHAGLELCGVILVILSGITLRDPSGMIKYRIPLSSNYNPRHSPLAAWLWLVVRGRELRLWRPQTPVPPQSHLLHPWAGNYTINNI